jgi:hypothetical protein
LCSFGAPEVGVEPRHVLARDRIDLRVAEEIRLLRLRDDERLVGKSTAMSATRNGRFAPPVPRRSAQFTPGIGR